MPFHPFDISRKVSKASKALKREASIRRRKARRKIKKKNRRK